MTNSLNPVFVISACRYPLHHISGAEPPSRHQSPHNRQHNFSHKFDNKDGHAFLQNGMAQRQQIRRTDQILLKYRQIPELVRFIFHAPHPLHYGRLFHGKASLPI